MSGPPATTADPVPADGRRARTQRGRAKVVDAAFALLNEGHVPPPVELVAARAGVSVSSVFRYFDGLDDVHRQALERFRERYGPLFAIEQFGCGTRAERIDRFLAARIEMYEQAGMLLVVAALRALDREHFRDPVIAMRTTLADQVRAQFRPELCRLDAQHGADLVATIDAATSPEAWHITRHVHARGRHQITRAWTTALTALLEGAS